MKRLYPDSPDVSQSIANKGAKIIEKHLKVNNVSRAKDLPEDAKVRLYRDLRHLFEVNQNPDQFNDTRFSLKKITTILWERISDFLSTAEAHRLFGNIAILSCFNLSGLSIVSAPHPVISNQQEIN